MNFDVSPQFFVTLNGRLGYALGNFLPYVYAGAAWTKLSISHPIINITVTNTYTAPVLGLGLEYRFADHWSVDFKYSHIELPKRTYDFGGGPEQYGERADNFMVSVNFRL
jgi:opacity protein-like surface antigen